jgi:hyperosmotically inducible protein
MRTIIRALLVLVVVAVAGVMLLIFYPSVWPLQKTGTGAGSPDAGTSGIDTGRARERAAEIGGKAVEATKRIQDTVSETGLTAKIKAKIALDDTLKASAINVSTEGSTVTVGGTVPSVAARTRAIALARETDGVITVVDRLEVVPSR